MSVKIYYTSSNNYNKYDPDKNSEDRLKKFLRIAKNFFLFFSIILCVYISIVILTYLSNRNEIAVKVLEYKKWVNGYTNQITEKPIKIFSAQNELIGNYTPIRGSFINTNRCSALKWLNIVTVEIEDQKFYSHHGFSISSSFRALWHDLLALNLVEGGGTITQQLARTLFTGNKRSIYRKLYETLIAMQMEDLLSKNEILCLYLNKIYMGEGRSGAEQASWFYFNKAPENLDLAEAAMIVGIFPRPALYSPLNNIAFSLKKQKLILDKLNKNKKITLVQKNKAIKDFQKKYKVSLFSTDSGNIGLYGASRNFTNNLAPTANDYIKSVLYKIIPEEIILKGNLNVYTTINLDRERKAMYVMHKFTDKFRKQMLKSNTKADEIYLKKLVDRLNGAFVSLDANTGAVLAVVGAFDINENNSSHRIWNMYRQPGSSIKGILYATALEEKILQINSTVSDLPSETSYKPKNWNKKYLGEIALSKAVAMSVNSVAINTLKKLGVDKFQKK